MDQSQTTTSSEPKNLPKKKRKLTKKERGFVKDYVLTENGTQSVLKNYDAKNAKVASVIAVENLAKPRIQEAIEEKKKTIAEQIPDDLLVKVHLEGLEANRVISARITSKEANENTDDFIEVPDHTTRQRFLDTAYKLKGSYAPEKSVNVNVDVEASQPIKDAADKLNALLRGGGQSGNGTLPDPLGTQASDQE